MKVTVQYFAILREQRGSGEEVLETSAADARELYVELSDQHGLTMTTEAMKVVVNEEFRNWDEPLNDGDVVVFIPPVAGG